MKRSEALDRLEYAIWDARFDNEDFDGCVDEARVTDRVLSFIEDELEMTPPCYEISAGCTCCSDIIEDWEPEN